MANVLVEERYLKDIADAIRAKNLLTDKYTPADMADAILDLSGGGGEDSTPILKMLARSTGSGTAVLLSNEVTDIGIFAFYNNEFISNITGPEVTDIGQYAFARGTQINSNQATALITARFPELLSVQNYAFYDNRTVQSVAMPKVTSIGDYAFYGCAALAIESFPATLTSIGANAFENCTSLAIEELPSGLVTIGQRAFYNCTLLAIEEIPLSVKSIGANAFYRCDGVTDLTIPAIEITSNATVIGNTAFQNMRNLERLDVTLGSGSDSITATYGNNVFSNCPKLETLIVRVSGKYLRGYNLFSGNTALKYVTLPQSGYDQVYQNEFSECTALEEIDLPSTVTQLNSSAFSGCTSLRRMGWDNCQITNFAGSCLYNTGFTELVIPEGVTTIGSQAVAYCTKLNSITIPSTMTNAAGNGAFRNNTVLKEVIFKGTPSAWGAASGTNSAFYNDLALTDIWVPWSSGDVANAPWGATNATIHYDSPVNGENITEVHVSGSPSMLNREGRTAKFTVRFNKFCYEDQKEVTWSVTGSPNVSIDQNGLLTINIEDSTDYTVTVTATSVVNRSISDSFTVSIGQAYISIDLNEGQWVDSGTEIDGNIVYKSDAGSYNIDNGASRARISFAGYQKIVVQIRSYAESSYDYTMAGNLDIAGYSRTTNTNTVKQHTQSKQSSTNYYAAIYENMDGENHFIEILYAKDSSANSNDDRGYFYIDTAQCIRA